MKFTRSKNEGRLFVVGSHPNKNKKIKEFPLPACSIAVAFLLFISCRYQLAYAMPLSNNPGLTTLASEPNIVAAESSRQFAKSFLQENQNLAAFCDALSSQTTRGAHDAFSWIQGLTPAGGVTPFAMAVPSHNHGGAIGRSLERRGTWQPELTEDLLNALDQAGPDSVFIDIRAGLGWFSFAAVTANHSALAFENDKLNIASVRRSACSNYNYDYDSPEMSSNSVVLLGNIANSGSKAQQGLALEEMLLNAAPKIIEALLPSASQPLEQREGGEGNNMRAPLLARGAVVLVHPETSRGALEVIAAGAHAIWPEIKPSIIAMVLPADNENSGGKGNGAANYKSQFDEQDTENVASLVFRRMHALGYDVRMDALTNMA
jgi:hypothetical protein